MDMLVQGSHSHIGTPGTNNPSPPPTTGLSSTLFVAEVPYGFQESDFSDLFERLEGFKSARLRKDRNSKIVGFVEFNETDTASRARERLQSYKGINIQFSRQKTRTSSSHSDKGAAHTGGTASNHNAPNNVVSPSTNNVATNHTSHASNHSSRNSKGVAPESSFYGSFPGNPLFPFTNPALFPTLPEEACNTLYVEGLPLDATEREVAHIFRPIPGYQSLRIVPKESNKYPSRSYNLCFVEFDNKYQATIALHHLQGYRMDKNDTKGLKISYAKTERKDRRSGPGFEMENNRDQEF